MVAEPVAGKSYRFQHSQIPDDPMNGTLVTIERPVQGTIPIPRGWHGTNEDGAAVIVFTDELSEA